MDFNDLLRKRKAIRIFHRNALFPQKDIVTILENILLAPSARNLQSYKVFILKNRKVISAFAESCFNQRSDFIFNASLVMVFCSDPDKAIESFGQRGEKLYTLQDATIACTIAMLSAVDLGYATCWVGNFNEEKVKKLIKSNLTPVASLIIGESSEDPDRKVRKPIREISEII